MLTDGTTPDTGDVLFTRASGLASRVTCWFTGMASHQATFFDSTAIVEAKIETGRIEKVPWASRCSAMEIAHTEWIIFHWVFPPLSHWRRAAVQRDLDESVRFEKYSALELPLQGLDVLLNRWALRRPRQGLDAAVFRRMGDLWKNGVICSKTSNRSLIRNGFISGDSGLEYGSPSDTYRYLSHQALQINATVKVAAHTPGWFRHAV